jgi:hypothetical protein
MRIERFTWGQDNPPTFHDETVDYSSAQPRSAPGEISPHGGEFAATGGITGPLKGSQGDPSLISTAYTTAKGRSKREREQLASEVNNYQRADMDQVRKDPTFFEALTNTFRNEDIFPYMRRSDFNGNTEHDARAVIDRIKSNLHALWNDISQDERLLWRGWYEGAHNLITDRMKQYPGVDRASMTAMYAVQSAGTMWDVNVHLGDRVLDTVFHHASDKWDKGMADAAQTQLENAVKGLEKKGEKAKQNVKEVRKLFNEVKKAGSFTAQKDDRHRAAWVKLWNDAHDNTPVREVGIDGKMGAPIKNKGVDENGDPAELSGAFGTLNRIENALRALHSKGDLNEISSLLGRQHKVRSFYNNILDPNSANDDVTVDTHAGGAAWLDPLGSHSTVIDQMLGGSPRSGEPASPKSDKLGIRATYPFYADAYREVAKEVGLDRPRELQSILWEHKISLFKNAPKAKKALVREAWQRFHDNPNISLEQTQQRVLRIAKSGYDLEERRKRRERMKDGTELDYWSDEAIWHPID